MFLLLEEQKKIVPKETKGIKNQREGTITKLDEIKERYGVQKSELTRQEGWWPSGIILMKQFCG